MPIVCEPQPKYPTPFATDLGERIIELIRTLTTEGLPRTPKHNVIGSLWNSVPFRCKGAVPEAFVFASLEFDGMYSSEQIYTAIEELRQTDPPILETAEASVIPLGSFYTLFNPHREVYSFVHNTDSSLPASASAMYPMHPIVLSFDCDGEKLGPWQWQVWSNRGDYRAIFAMRPDVFEWQGKQNVRRLDLAKSEQIPAIRLTASARSKLNILGTADNILQKVFVPGRPPVTRPPNTHHSQVTSKKPVQGASPKERHFQILQAMKELRADCCDRRRNAGEIALKAIGEAEPNKVKKELADLKRWQLVDSQSGPGGGSWMTPKGLEALAEHDNKSQ